MSELVSMARTKAERKGEDKSSKVVMAQAAKWPWGLELRLEQESLEKLGREVGDFTVGATVDVVCKARVTGVRSSEGEGGKSSCVELQVESMALRTGKDKADAAFKDRFK